MVRKQTSPIAIAIKQLSPSLAVITHSITRSHYSLKGRSEEGAHRSFPYRSPPIHHHPYMCTGQHGTHSTVHTAVIGVHDHLWSLSITTHRHRVVVGPCPCMHGVVPLHGHHPHWGDGGPNRLVTPGLVPGPRNGPCMGHQPRWGVQIPWMCARDTCRHPRFSSPRHSPHP